MTKIPLIRMPIVAAIAYAALGGVGTLSHASAQMIPLGGTPAATVAVFDATCKGNVFLAPVDSKVLPTDAKAAKSAAILGGELSALDRIKMKQSAGQASLVTVDDTSLVEGLVPAAGGMRTPTPSACATLGASNIAGTMNSPLEDLSKDDFLASKKVRIGKTSFDSNWRRVRRESMRGTLRREFGRRVDPTLETIDKVNRWVNRTVAYVEDRELFKKADYWAGARRTLELGQGDCEDYALTKMQLLAAAGIPRSDMFLTIARDRVRNADHALLVVKLEDRYLVLDNATDELLDGALSHDYAPVLSFSDRESWLHGY